MLATKLCSLELNTYKKNITPTAMRTLFVMLLHAARAVLLIETKISSTVKSPPYAGGATVDMILRIRLTLLVKEGSISIKKSVLTASVAPTYYPKNENKKQKSLETLEVILKIESKDRMGKIRSTQAGTRSLNCGE